MTPFGPCVTHRSCVWFSKDAQGLARVGARRYVSRSTSYRLAALSPAELLNVLAGGARSRTEDVTLSGILSHGRPQGSRGVARPTVRGVGFVLSYKAGAHHQYFPQLLPQFRRARISGPCPRRLCTPSVPGRTTAPPRVLRLLRPCHLAFRIIGFLGEPGDVGTQGDS